MNLFSNFRLWIAAAACGIALHIIPTSVNAQATASPPGKVSFQGFLTDANGVPLGNTTPINTNVVFRIFSTALGGAPKWSEQQTVTVDKGQFSVLLGEGSAFGSEATTDNLTSVFSGSDASDRYMELTVNTTTLLPRIQFLPAPYAFLARNANAIVGIDGTPMLTTGVGALTVNATVSSTVGFSGNGANLTALNGANITAGTIADAKLATIGTAGKVANSATTATAANTPNGIVARDASGNFSAGAITATSISGNGTIPLGGIIMWSGASVPAGWALCNGLNGTPDLRDRFIVGSGGAYATGATGGAPQTTLVAGNLPTFSISKQVMTTGYTSGYGSGQEVITAPSRSQNSGFNTFTMLFTGQSLPMENRPPYYALAFIMRVN